ncbi:MAG: hypothetical protein HYV09_21800 [Deltaproteobacteria bacterium]|nr:hypothetical protein [Deltaproteobacteria bacterium]
MGYLSSQFAADLDRLGFKPTRKIAPSTLDDLEASLREVAEGESEVVLDLSARLYIRIMHERATGQPRRAPDFEEVVQGSTWLADPTNPSEAAECFDTGGDVPPAGLLCLGEWKSGELWLLDVAVKHGYVYLVTERREVLPMFRSIAEFAQWAVANELWKRRTARDGELAERLSAIRFFRSVSFLREAGLVPQNFRPKRWKPKFTVPVALDRPVIGEP